MHSARGALFSVLLRLPGPRALTAPRPAGARRSGLDEDALLGGGGDGRAGEDGGGDACLSGTLRLDGRMDDPHSEPFMA